jgi:glucokinase
MAHVYLGVDLGGTKILTAVVDEHGRVLHRVRVATPPSGPDDVIEAIASTVDRVMADAGIAPGAIPAIGVGAPGPSDPRTGVVFEPPNLPGWRNVPLAERLTAYLRVPVHVENDANAAALGEHWAGAGAGVRDLVYITVSTGVGGGLILDGRLYHGASGTAGEVGHMLVEPGGPRCGCGRLGCLEAVASGTAIAREARAAVAEGRPTALSVVPASDLDAEAVARAASDGDPAAREIYARVGAAMGAAVTNLVNLLGPEVVIIGGGVARAGELVFAPVRRIVREEAFERPGTIVRIVPAALGADAGVIGAAAVVRARAG